MERCQEETEHLEEARRHLEYAHSQSKRPLQVRGLMMLVLMLILDVDCIDVKNIRFGSGLLPLNSLNLNLPMLLKFVSTQTISRFERFSTKIARNGNPSDMIGFDVVPHCIPSRLNPTHLAYSWGSVGIVTGHHH